MLPEQVSDAWDQFAPLIELSLPPLINKRRERMSNVLRAVLMEDLYVWVAYDGDKRERIVFSTIIQVEPVTLVKSLLIYSFTAVRKDLTKGEVERVFATLERYARGNKCESIVAYSDRPEVVSFLQKNGADVSFNFIQFQL